MERVETLLQQLQQQFKNGASASQLLLTVQLLQHQLQHVQATEPASTKPMATISMPVSEPVIPVIVDVPNTPITEIPLYKAPAEPIITIAEEPKVAPVAPVEEEKTFEVLQVDEAAIEAELEELKRNAAVIQQITVHSKPHLLFDPAEDEIPTLVHQNPPKKEVNEAAAVSSPSINESLQAVNGNDLGSRLTDTPVKDLKKAIGINDRFLYINDLFRGDEAMYERSIKTINGFSIWPEAEYWIRRELKTKLGWSDSHETVIQFDQLVKRRFS